jgi:hypothetical protein
MPTLPDSEKIKQTLARAHRHCQEMELAGIELEFVIAQLEQETRTRRKDRLAKLLKTEKNE